MKKVLNQMNVGELIVFLEKMPPKFPVGFAPGIYVGDVGSYRGYYEDLAFAIVTYPRAVEEIIQSLKVNIGAKMEGYKGGTYTISETTALWAADHGQTGPAIIGAELKKSGWVKLLTTPDA